MSKINSTKDALFALDEHVEVEGANKRELKKLAFLTGEQIYMECTDEGALKDIFSALTDLDLKRSFLRGAKKTLGSYGNVNTIASINMLPFVNREYRRLTL